MKKSEQIMENVKEILQIILVIVVVIVLGAVAFYRSYLEFDTKIKMHETYKNAAENIGNQ